MISSELKAKVEQKIQECMESYLGKERAAKYPVKLVFRTDMTKVAGLAYRGTNKIEINEPLFLANIDGFFSDTIPHEVAHLLQYIVYPRAKQAHGPEWKRILTSLGSAPVRCHNYDLSVIPNKTYFRYTCDCGKLFNLTPLMHKKVTNGSIRICRTCKGRIMFWPKDE